MEGPYAVFGLLLRIYMVSKRPLLSMSLVCGCEKKNTLARSDCKVVPLVVDALVCVGMGGGGGCPQKSWVGFLFACKANVVRGAAHTEQRRSGTHQEASYGRTR